MGLPRYIFLGRSILISKFQDTSEKVYQKSTKHRVYQHLRQPQLEKLQVLHLLNNKPPINQGNKININLDFKKSK